MDTAELLYPDISMHTAASASTIELTESSIEQVGCSEAGALPVDTETPEAEEQPVSSEGQEASGQAPTEDPQHVLQEETSQPAIEPAEVEVESAMDVIVETQSQDLADQSISSDEEVATSKSRSRSKSYREIFKHLTSIFGAL